MCVPVLCSVPRIGHRFTEFPERVQYALSIHGTLEFSGTGSDSVVMPVKGYTSLSEKVVDMIDVFIADIVVVLRWQRRR